MNPAILFLLLSLDKESRDIELDDGILIYAVIGLVVGAIVGLGIVPLLIVLFWSSQ